MEQPETSATPPVFTCPLNSKSQLSDPEREKVNRKYRDNPWYKGRTEQGSDGRTQEVR